MSKEIIAALAAASKAVKALPPAPTFDPAPLRAAFEAAQLPEKFIESALRESEAKFIATHGDTGERLIQTVLAEIADSLGGIETLALVAKRMASDVKNEGKISVTGKQWEAALMGEADAKAEHVTLAKRAAKMRAEERPRPWSEIRDELGLADAARAQLYNLVTQNPEMERLFKALAKA